MAKRRKKLTIVEIEKRENYKWGIMFFATLITMITYLAIFAEMDYDLSDKWQVRLGVRWMDTRKDSLARSGVLDINQFQSVHYATEAEANASLPQNRANFETVTGRVIFDYQINEDTLLYFGFNRGTKPGGYEPAVDTQSAVQRDDILVDAEEHDIFEIWEDATISVIIGCSRDF